MAAHIGDDVIASPSHEIYWDVPYLSIYCDRQHTYVLSEWKGFSTSLELRAGSDKTLDAIRDTHAALLIVDNRRLEGVTPLDQIWIRDTFIQLLEAAGVSRVALVVAQHGLAKIATDAIHSQSAKPVPDTRVFSTVSEAIAWVTA